MIAVTYPNITPKIKKQNNADWIFCIIRKKWLVLTPEEWVRQNFILYVTHTLQYPLLLVAVEKKIKIGEVEKRFDILIYNKELKADILIECKEMTTKIDKHTIAQAMNYFTVIQSNYIIITNGNQTYCFKKSDNQLLEVEYIPTFKK